MKLFIDTANLKEIGDANDLGVLDGVTTNPSLIAREGISGRQAFEKHIKAICEIVQAPVSAEAVSLDARDMVEEARKLAAIDEHVVVKIPMTAAGLEVVSEQRVIGRSTEESIQSGLFCGTRRTAFAIHFPHRPGDHAPCV